MLRQLALITAITLAFFSQSAQGAVITSREDVTREVYIPKGQSLTEFCSSWEHECDRLAHHEGEPSDVCHSGYDGSGTARVDCLAVTSNTTAVDYTDRVVKALGISFVVA